MLKYNGSILKVNNGASTIDFASDPYNPLGLPPRTIRVKFAAGTEPSPPEWAGIVYTKTLVDATDNIWDVTTEGTSWALLLSSSEWEGTSMNLLEVLGANAEEITDMSSMFGGCAAITSVPLFATSNVTNMSSMFSECTSLVTVPIFDLTNVDYVSQMFYGCTSMTTAPFFNLSNVSDVYGMFENCSSLTTVPAYALDNCTSTGSMFAFCTSLTTVPQLDLSNMTDTGWMFNGCTSFTTIPLLNLPNIESMSGMFQDCTNVQSGALALYQQLSTQSNPPQYHEGMFMHCGQDTQTGLAELNQIPTSWGGNLLTDLDFVYQAKDFDGTKIPNSALNPVFGDYMAAGTLTSNGSGANCYLSNGLSSSNYLYVDLTTAQLNKIKVATGGDYYTYFVRVMNSSSGLGGIISTRNNDNNYNYMIRSNGTQLQIHDTTGRDLGNNFLLSTDAVYKIRVNKSAYNGKISYVVWNMTTNKSWFRTDTTTSLSMGSRMKTFDAGSSGECMLDRFYAIAGIPRVTNGDEDILIANMLMNQSATVQTSEPEIPSNPGIVIEP